MGRRLAVRLWWPWRETHCGLPRQGLQRCPKLATVRVVPLRARALLVWPLPCPARLIGDLPEQPRSPVSTLFEEGQALRKLMLWLTFFCGLFVFYLLTNWLPTILRSSGYGPSESSMISMGGFWAASSWHCCWTG